MRSVLAILKDILQRLNIISDYVIEEGETTTTYSGYETTWEYTKWKSGKVEMIGRRQVSLTTSNWVASGNGYYAAIYASTYPFTLAKVPKITRNAWNSEGYYASIGSNVSTIVPSTTISGTFSLLRFSKPSATLVFNTEIHVIGKLANTST